MVKTYDISKGNVKLSANFSLSEFQCHDGSKKILIDTNLINKLQELRNVLKTPITINSAYRSPSYNAKIGGAKESQHMNGTAVDITAKGYTPEQIKVYAKAIGFNGIGLYDNFIHVDVRSVKAEWDERTKKKQYNKIRKFDTDIHIYNTDSSQTITIDFGKVGREKLSTIAKNASAAVNGGFFNLDGSSEHLGSFGKDGLHWHDPDPVFIDFILHKDGKTEIKYIQGNAECVKLQADKATYFGTSYSLIINGKIDIRGEEYFSHATGKNSRTMLGQRADGTFVLAVADKKLGSKGLNCNEQAQLMLELGCVNAVNLDGGGSSEMIVNSKVMNKPDDGCERKIGSAILVVDKG